MAITDLRFIDSDGHILEHPTAMPAYAPAEFRDRIWHVETDGEGREWAVFNGDRTPSNSRALAGTAGFTDEQVDAVRRGEVKYSECRPAAWTAKARLADLDTDSIDLSVLYPTMLFGLQALTDLPFAVAQARAYNDWCSDHVQEGEGRLFGAGALPPMNDAEGVAAVAAEIRRVAELPGHGLGVRPAQPDRRLEALPHEPTTTPSGRPPTRRDSPSPSIRSSPPTSRAPVSVCAWPSSVSVLTGGRPWSDGDAVHSEQALANIYFSQGIANPADVMASIAYITAGGVCERFPNAKFIFLEANGGWLVPWLERLDHHAEKFSWDVPWLTMKPSEYFRRQCWISFDPDESMLAFTANSPLCGADRIIWASDYPHPDAKFPGVTRELTEALEGLSDEQKRQITSESARALYGIG